MSCVTVPSLGLLPSLPSFRAAFGATTEIHSTATMRYSAPATIGGDVKGDSPTHRQQLPRLQQRLDDLQHQRGDLSPLARPFQRVDALNNNDEADSDDGNDARDGATPLVPDHSVERLLSLPEPTVAAGVTLPARSPSWSETSSSVSNQSPREGEAASGGTEGAKRKRPRFLGDIDRRMIIQRLENGEKQADLAREFGVTRAAICHINKNRDEILTRFDILAKSPQGRQMIENYVRSPHFSSCVRELRTPSVAVLLTRLRDAALSLATFKSTADRLMTMLLEEALVGFGTRAVGVEDLVGASYEGKEYARAAYALALGERGRPLLNAFAVMEPTAFRGFVHVDHAEATDAPNASSALVLRRLDLPEDATEANVLLCQVALDTAQRTGFAVEALLARGVASSRICVVCVTAAADAVSAFASRFRDVKLVTAAINADMDAPRLAGFVDKYQRAASL